MYQATIDYPHAKRTRSFSYVRSYGGFSACYPRSSSSPAPSFLSTKRFRQVSTEPDEKHGARFSRRDWIKDAKHARTVDLPRETSRAYRTVLSGYSYRSIAARGVFSRVRKPAICCFDGRRYRIGRLCIVRGFQPLWLREIHKNHRS